ncbi:MAG: hypothetical protein QOE06_1351 [Thermoleophilaceae bacterium]|jgi:hypothetical protein|nr:hypothetical protein [Thermoleophilaceae bacterium]
MVGAVIATALAAVASPAAAFDLTVTHVEVTQAIQNDTNSIELVAGRSTAVRATIGTAGQQGGTPVPVNGRLHVFQNGTELTPAAGVPAMNQPFAPPASPNPANENDTLNFELPAPTGIGNSSDVDFRVDLAPQRAEESLTNNSGFASNLVARVRSFPRVYFMRVNYAGGGLPDLAFVRPGTGDAFMCGILPVDDSQPELYRQAPLPSLVYNEDSDGDGFLDKGVDEDHLMAKLAAQRQLLVDNGLGANDLTHLYGWLKGPVGGNGLGQLPGHTAFGNTDPVRGQRSFAHELTHNLGLDHVNRSINPFLGWDVGAGLDANPAANNTTGRVKPQPRFDIQVPGQLTNSAWVDQIDYQYMLNYSEFAPEDPFARIRKLAQRYMLVVRGRVDPGGQKVTELDPAFRYPWLSEATPPPSARAQLQVTVKTTDGKTVKVGAAAITGNDEDPGAHTKQGYFEAMVPVSGTVASVQIARRSTSPLHKSATPPLAGRTRSIHRPQIASLRALGGNALEGRRTIDWTAHDTDTKAKDVRFQAAYSPDNGKSFVPIGVDFKGSKLTFDTSEVPPSKGTGIIRIFASDGLNSTYRDLKGISVNSVVQPAPTACQDP